MKKFFWRLGATFWLQWFVPAFGLVRSWRHSQDLWYFAVDVSDDLWFPDPRSTVEEDLNYWEE